MTNKYKIMLITSGLLQVFERLKTNNGCSTHRLFAESLACLLGEYFEGTSSLYHSGDIPYVAINLPPLNTNIYNEKSSPEQLVQKQILISPQSHYDFSQLLSAFKKHLIAKTPDTFNIAKIDSKTRTIAAFENGQNQYTKTEYIKNSHLKLSYSSTQTDEIGEDFYEILITAGIFTGDEDFELVPDFFECTWNSVADMTRQALLSYYVQHGGFRGINICKTCEQIYVAKRRGNGREPFCSENCRKKSYNRTNKQFISCQNKHRNKIESLVDYITVFPKSLLSGAEHDELVSLRNKIRTSKPIPPSSNVCRPCEENTIARLNNTKVKTGKCPHLLSNECFRSMLVFKASTKKYRKDIRLAELYSYSPCQHKNKVP